MEFMVLISSVLRRLSAAGLQYGIIHEFELDSARFCGCYNYYISDIARRHADEMSGVEVETI